MQYGQLAHSAETINQENLQFMILEIHNHYSITGVGKLCPANIQNFILLNPLHIFLNSCFLCFGVIFKSNLSHK